MTAQALVAHAQGALFLALLVSLPVVVVAALVGLLVGAFQSATQVQDPSVSHLPKMVAGGVALAVAAPWMGHAIATFAERMLLAAGS
jgi:type III secretory pathway component EscS